MNFVPTQLRSRDTARGVALGALALTFGVLTACGGKGGSSKPAPTLSNLAGAWVDAANTTAVVILPETGAFRTLSTSQRVFSGSFTVSGTSLAGKASSFLWGPPTAQTAVNQMTLSGSASTDSLNPTLTDGGGGRTTLALIRDDKASEVPSLASIVGTYNAAAEKMSNTTGATVNISASGALSGGDSLGSLKGSIGQVSATANAFNVTFTYTPSDTELSALSFTGVAYVRTKASPAELVLIADNGTAPYAGLFTKISDPTTK